MSGMLQLLRLKVFTALLAVISAGLGCCNAERAVPGARVATWDWGAFAYPYGISAAVALLALAVLMLITHEPRIVPGHCYRCGYDLTGNVTGRCPECGEHVGRPLI